MLVPQLQYSGDMNASFEETHRGPSTWIYFICNRSQTFPYWKFDKGLGGTSWLGDQLIGEVMGLVRSGHHSDHIYQKSLFCKNKQFVTVLQLLWKYVCIGQVEEPREQWAGGRGIWERGLGCHLSSGEDSPHPPPHSTLHCLALFCTILKYIAPGHNLNQV